MINEEFHSKSNCFFNESLNDRYVIVKKLAKKLVGQMYLIEDRLDYERF